MGYPYSNFCLCAFLGPFLPYCPEIASQCSGHVTTVCDIGSFLEALVVFVGHGQDRNQPKTAHERTLNPNPP